MIEGTENSSQAQPTLTAGERYFPTPETLRSRLEVCRINLRVIELLVEARISQADHDLVLWRRHLLEACTLTTASFSQIAIHTNAHDLRTLDKITISNNLRTIVTGLSGIVNNVGNTKYEVFELTPVRLYTKGSKHYRHDSDLEYADPALFIPDKIFLPGKSAAKSPPKDRENQQLKNVADNREHHLQQLRLEMAGIDRELQELQQSAKDSSRGWGQNNFFDSLGNYQELLEQKKSLTARIRQMSAGG